MTDSVIVRGQQQEQPRKLNSAPLPTFPLPGHILSQRTETGFDASSWKQ